MLPLEVVYAFDPVPPEPQHEEPPTPMSRSGDGDSDGSGMDVEASSNGMGDGGGVSHTPAYADWTLPAKDAHHIIGGQARFQRQNAFGLPPFGGLRSGSMRALPYIDAFSQRSHRSSLAGSTLWFAVMCCEGKMLKWCGC